MNTQENKIPLLQEVLNEYEMGTLDLTQAARKCYLSERERASGRVTWIHNDELKGQLLLKKMSGNNTKDLLKNTKLI
jgi:hypothetical protein